MDRDELVEFIRESAAPVGARDIVRAFGLGGAMRRPLMQMVRELLAAGQISAIGGNRFIGRERESEIVVLDVARIGRGGDAYARASSGTLVGREIWLRSSRHAPKVGDRVLVRLETGRKSPGAAEVLRVLPSIPPRLVAIFSGDRRGGILAPVDRRIKQSPTVRPGDLGGAKSGELVLAEIADERPMAVPRYRIVERLGHPEAPQSASLIALHQHGIPSAFSAAAIAEARRLRPDRLGGRADLRGLPLVTIDGADARDFDDAVFAAPDDNPANAGGWRIIVAIADVAHYVRPASALDESARERGNSVYFPDRVVPMLPEELSNDLCSLRPAEDRACLAAHLLVDAEGALLDHRFERGLMRSSARLTYDQVQRARDGSPDDITRPLIDRVISPLYRAFGILDAARRRRHTLELDLPERKIIFDEQGGVRDVRPQQRLDSHRLVEEMMILANVAAAETLDEQRRPCLYRVHDSPDPAKLAGLCPVFRELGIAIAPGGMRAADFNRILEQTRGSPHQRLIHELVLRTQAQARYSPANRGHFGLALRRYAHFTSPIRRYADLLVHRSLVGEVGTGNTGERQSAEWESIADHISAAERRGMAAEREAFNRYVAAFLAGRVGAEFAGTISGVARFGLFVSLVETGADGLVPMARLPYDSYRHDAERHCLIGHSSGQVFRLGDAVTVQLVDIDLTTASMSFAMIDHEPAARSTRPPATKHRRRRY